MGHQWTRADAVNPGKSVSRGQSAVAIPSLRNRVDEQKWDAVFVSPDRVCPFREGLVGSNASHVGAGRTQHAATQKECISLEPEVLGVRTGDGRCQGKGLDGKYFVILLRGERPVAIGAMQYRNVVLGPLDFDDRLHLIFVAEKRHQSNRPDPRLAPWCVRLDRDAVTKM